jgi:hypothetical protein
MNILIKGIDKANTEYIVDHVTDLFSYSLSSFSFEDIIGCSDKLTDEEKEWAKENLDWKIYILGE